MNRSAVDISVWALFHIATGMKGKWTFHHYASITNTCLRYKGYLE